jgi:hypothetical protein
MNAKEEMARQASEYYSNKDLWREELSRYKQILNEVIASMNSIIENANTRPSARRKAEKQRAECKENLQDLLVAEILQAYDLSTKPKKRNTKDHIVHHLLRQKLLFLILHKEYLLFRCRSHPKASSSAKQLLKFMHIFTILQ